MNTVLYSLRFNWANLPWLMIPLIMGIGAFCLFRMLKNMESVGQRGRIFFKWFSWIVSGFLLLIFFLDMALNIYDYMKKKNQLDHDQVFVVEGFVENYHAMPLQGHDTEHFEIDGVFFEYSNYELINGYNRPACRGGVITGNGQYLIIKYVTDAVSNNNIILYIEEKR